MDEPQNAPRPASELRRLLESIHQSVPQVPPGSVGSPASGAEPATCGSLRTQVALRSLLESIHRNVPQPPAGPGAPAPPPKSNPESIPTRCELGVQHAARSHRRLLLDNGATVGGIAGTLLGANAAAVLFCLPQASPMLLPVAVLAASVAGTLGAIIAWRVIVTRRRDLFLIRTE